MASTREKAGNAAYAIFRPGKYMQAKADEKAAEEELQNAERIRQESMDLAKQLNWEPDYVSDLMPAYQRAQSPVARGFLESLLSGANPSMVQGTRLGADRLRAGAQARFDDQTGGWEELQRRQREAEQATPWAPGKFGSPAVMPLGGRYVGPRVGGEVPPPSSAPGWSSVAGEGVGENMQGWGITPEYLQRVEDADEELQGRLPAFLRKGR